MKIVSWWKVLASCVAITILCVIVDVIGIDWFNDLIQPNANDKSPIPCVIQSLSTQDWNAYTIVHTPVAIRLPIAFKHDQSITSDERILLSTGSILFSISPDPRAIHINEAFQFLPEGMRRRRERRCYDLIAGKRVTIETYKARGMIDGEYAADIAWPIMQGSWLTFGITSPTMTGRDSLIAMVQSLYVDTLGKNRMEIIDPGLHR